ncbi:MAG: hypothetical protein ACUVUU_04165 [bacterium]
MKRKLIAIALLMALGSTSSYYAQSSSSEQRVPDFVLGRCGHPDSIILSNSINKPVLLCFLDAGDASMMCAYPYLDAWRQRFSSDSLEVIGIHCPQYEPLKDQINACSAISKCLVKSPIGLDLQLDVYKTYGSPKLPTFILLRPGLTIFRSISSPRPFLEVDDAIQKLLRELNPKGPIAFPLKPLRPEDDPKTKLLPSTPKIDMGYASVKIDGCDSTMYDKFAIYEDKPEREKNKIYLNGRWKVEASKITCQSDQGHLRHSLRLIYSGKTVWVLLSKPSDGSAKVFIKQDGAYLPTELWGWDVMIDRDTGYPKAYSKYDVPLELVKNEKFGSHQLQLIVEGSDVSFYYLYFEPESAP